MTTLALTTLLATNLCGMESIAGKHGRDEEQTEQGESRKKNRTAPTVAVADFAMQTDETPQVHDFKRTMLKRLLEQLDSNGQPPLHQAVIRKDASGIKDLLEAGADINATNSGKESALALAAVRSFPAMVTLLVSQPFIHLNTPHRDYYTRHRNPLYCAMKRGSSSMVQTLLNAGASVHGTPSPLHHWSENVKKSPTIGKLLLERGVQVNQEDDIGRTALDIVSSSEKQDSLQAAKLLSKYGADIFRRSRKTGLSAFDRVAGSTSAVTTYIQKEWQQGLLTIAATLHLKMGLPKPLVELIMRRDILENTPQNLFKVIKHGYAEAIDRLLHNQFMQINDPLIGGMRPLHIAIARNQTREWTEGHPDISATTLLLERGANVDAQSNSGSTPLHLAIGHSVDLAAQRGYVSDATLLLDHGADVNAQNNNDSTPLHTAAFKDCNYTATLLLDRGANVNAQDKNGNIPLHLAALYGQVPIATLFLDRGANVNAQNNHDRTPLHLACFKKHRPLIELLQGRGADITIKDKRDKTPQDYLDA